jgi:LysM repeat protein
VIGTSVDLSVRELRRRVLVGALAVGVGLAGCGGGSDGHPTKAKGSTTTVSPSTTIKKPTAIRFTVRRGDTLTKIARFFHVSVATIVQANQLMNGDRLTEGQVLVIPPHPLVRLVVTPRERTAGGSFEVELTGASPGEVVRFTIAKPDGTTFMGPPHTASPEGRVTTSYRTDVGEAAGSYTVVATGNQGTSIMATFQVKAETAIT